MGLENLLSQADLREIDTGLDGVYPLQIVRKTLGSLTMIWDIADGSNSTPSHWETTLRVNIKNRKLAIVGNYVSIDREKPESRWGEIVLPLYSNWSETTYNVGGQINIGSTEIVRALQAVTMGVMLYTNYKELSEEDRAPYKSQIIDVKSPPKYADDENLKFLSYIFGVRENPHPKVMR